jgi:hypothetical protein
MRAQCGNVALFAALVVIPSLLVRLPLMLQSLWYDEIYTIVAYVVGSWRGIVAGNYLPNNHILYTLLSKCAYELTGEVDAVLAARFISVLAGSIVGFVVAWPVFARGAFVNAVIVGLMVGLHPWLVSISGQARGYALLVLIAAVSTNLLCVGRFRSYTLSIAALMYTHPIGLMVLLGQGLSILLGSCTPPHDHDRSPAPALPDYGQRRLTFARWCGSTAIAACATAILYLPFIHSARSYWSGPQQSSSGSYVAFVLQSLAHAACGQMATTPLPLAAMSVLVICAALAFWRDGLAPRHCYVVFLTTSVLALLSPFAFDATAEVHAAIWLLLPVALGTYGLITSLCARSSSIVFVAAIFALSWLDLRIMRLPVQPIRDAIELARSEAAPGQPVVGVYMGAAETRAVYGLDAVAYKLHAAPGVAGLLEVEAGSPQPPILISIFDSLMKRDEPELWDYIQRHYTRSQRLTGREGDVLIYSR